MVAKAFQSWKLKLPIQATHPNINGHTKNLHFCGPTWGHSISAIVVAEDVAVDPVAQAEVETGHLTQVHRVPVRVQDGESKPELLLFFTMIPS